MRSMILVAVALVLVSCSRDPKRLLESGNKFFDRGKYREASLMYRNALKQDPKFGEAYYHLALTELKLKEAQNAINPLVRAIELLPHDNPDWTDANLKYAEILLRIAPGQKGPQKAATLAEVRAIKDKVLAREPKSFPANRLLAELTVADAEALSVAGKNQEARDKLEQAIGIYRNTLALKPNDTEIKLSLGALLLASGKAGEAEAQYQEVLDRDKVLIAPYQELYKLYVSQHKIPEAEGILKRAIVAHPDDTGLQYQLARHYYLVKNQPEMLKILSALHSNFKKDPDTFLKVGDFYSQIGRQDDAIREYQEGMTADRARKIDYQKRLIGALTRKGEKDAAFQMTNEALKTNPKDVQAREIKASLLLDRGESDAGITELQGVINSSPNSQIAHYNLGRAYFAKKDLLQAAQQFEAAISIRPDYMPARLGLTQIALLHGDWDKALVLVQGTLKINPNDGPARLLEASAYAHKGEFDKARPLLEELVRLNRHLADPLAELAVLDMMQKRYKEAEDTFRKAYEAEPSNLRGLLGIAQVRLRSNNPEGAIKVIADEVNKNPQRADLRKELANVELQARHYDNAIRDYQSALKGLNGKPVEQAEIYGRIGQACEGKGDFERGVDSYRQAKQLVPTNLFYISRVADLLHEAGKTQDALVAYQEAIKINPNDPRILNSLAWVMSNSGQNLDEALSLAQRAKQQAPKFDDASDTIGWIYLRKNMNDSAIEIFRDLTGRVKENPTYHYHYGMALAQKGDKLNALKELQAALQNNPNKNEAMLIRELVQKLS